MTEMPKDLGIINIPGHRSTEDPDIKLIICDIKTSLVFSFPQSECLKPKQHIAPGAE